MSASVTTPWKVEPCSGHNGHRAGFYVARKIDGQTFWMKDSKNRLARFNTDEQARAAIQKATT